LGEPGSAKNGGNWARSGHEKGFAANDRNWVVPGQAAFVKFSPKPDSLLPAQNLPWHLIKDEDRLGFQPK
jgi:hypothetical protein